MRPIPPIVGKRRPARTSPNVFEGSGSMLKRPTRAPKAPIVFGDRRTPRPMSQDLRKRLLKQVRGL